MDKGHDWTFCEGKRGTDPEQGEGKNRGNPGQPVSRPLPAAGSSRFYLLWRHCWVVGT
jgi:hypothetical protein